MTNKEILEKVLENCKDKQKVRDVLVEPCPEIYKFGQDCASGREALEELRFQVGSINYCTHDLQATFFKVRDTGLFEVIKHDLEDFEWLKSKLNLAFLDTLSSPEDKERLLKIMGIEISYKEMM